MNKFHKVKTYRMVDWPSDPYSRVSFISFIDFEVEPTYRNTKWRATIKLSRYWGNGRIAEHVDRWVDFDVIKAMERAQSQAFLRHTMTQEEEDASDRCYITLLQKLSKQFGFDLT
jgi:hypothetical protein